MRQVLSLTQLRKNLYGTIRLMIEANLTIKIWYRGKTYELSLKESDEQLKLSRRKRKKPPVEAVLTSVCPDCGDLLVADVCMNSRCAKETVQV